MSKIKDQFFAEKTFALLMSAQNTNNRERLFKGGGILLAMIKKTLFNMSAPGCFSPLRNKAFSIGSTRLTGTLLPFTSKPTRSIWHVICRSIFCSCDSVLGMTQFTCTLTGLGRIEYGSLTRCKDRPSGSLDLTHAV